MNIEKALVVDDSKVAHLTLRKLLTERNIEVDWVGSGEDAIAYMERQRPDVIFMDVMMPGMDGFETANLITNNSALTPPPIVMCSANATDEDKDNANKCGAAGFLSKPYTPAEMDQILDMVRSLEIEEPVAQEEAMVEEAVSPEVTESDIREPEKAAGDMADIERIAERAAWSMADKVARDVAMEIAKDKAEQIARVTAEQIARLVAEQATRKLAEEVAHKAVQAAIKIVREQSSTTNAENTEKTAQSVAEETVRSMLEQMNHKMHENLTRAIEVNRENLIKRLEEHVPHYVEDALTHAMKGQEFKQKLIKIMTESLLPRAELSAREAALEAADEAIINMEKNRKQANAALIISVIAILVGLGALAFTFLYS